MKDYPRRGRSGFAKRGEAVPEALLLLIRNEGCLHKKEKPEEIEVCAAIAVSPTTND
jgi:hypothetical protein